MMLTLKLAGLAFEVNAAATAPQDDPQGASSAALARLGILDVFHYAFSYIGVLTGQSQSQSDPRRYYLQMGTAPLNFGCKGMCQ
jgi:hypothetical protein